MTENTDEEEMIELDGDHPWIQAALTSYPAPVPSSAKLEPVSLPAREEGKTVPAALMTIVDPTGVKTIFLPPNALVQLAQQANAIFEFWDQEKRSGLIVADKGIEKIAKAQADAAAEAARIFRQ